VLDLIKDPLTHMVRNSADHGIETPTARRAAGKPERGTITLQACHEGGHVVIRIGDDGHGLDVERIRAKALANHLAGEHELAAMSREEILKFIFAPGFSTATQVTNVSGRGVGMDVVRNNIEKIAGVIDLASEPGRGTTFTIKIPLTLAIVSVLIVSAAGERFAIPQLGVVELVRAGGNAEHRLEVIDGAPILRLRDRLLPVVSLARVLELSDAMPSIDRPVYVIVTQIGASLVGILVDQVFDTEEIVVKPLAPILRNIRVFSGNTILGDGSVIMILDLNAVAGRLNLLAARHAEAMAQAEADETTTLLLFSAGGGAPKAVPLRLVTRLEEVAADDIEWSGAQTVTQYRGQLMPLIGIDGQPARIEAGRKPVLVFHDAGRGMGLVVDEIIDITETSVALDLRRQGASSIGSAIIAGKATELIDIAHYVTLVFGGWFAAKEAEPFRGGEIPAQKRVLLVDDSAFFRNLLTPLLETNNYRVLTAASAAQALQMRDDGCQADAIISDIEMPGMDGFAFVEACRAGGAWRDVPIVALTSHTTHRDVERGREAGFSNYVGKLDRGALLEALTEAQQLRGVA
jgi:two-component system chemotaxis sensor kinase CheA